MLYTIRLHSVIIVTQFVLSSGLEAIIEHKSTEDMVREEGRGVIPGYNVLLWIGKTNKLIF